MGKVLENDEFTREEIVCAKMLYNYVDASLMRIKNIDLPEKVIRETMQKRYGEKKRKLDNSIKEHPESVKTCEEFGHWVFDSVIGTMSLLPLQWWRGRHVNVSG